MTARSLTGAAALPFTTSASPVAEVCRDLWEGGFISVYKAMNSHSFAGRAQEGHCQRLENITGAPLPFEGVLRWDGILKWFSK